MIPIYVGYDKREAVAYHTFCNSVINRASQPVSFIPLSLNCLNGYSEVHKDGSNDFIYSRFLVPCLQDYQGWAIFVDGDMVCLDDISNLWNLRDDKYAAMVVKHNYKTKADIKYFGAKNEDYPKKNWSSVILWNCGHQSNRALTMSYVTNATGAQLHRFEHLKEHDVGEISKEWNWLAVEYDHYNRAKLVHYTLGTPCLSDYAGCNMSEYWHAEYIKSQKGVGV
jgi:lipopolysaccharide biosynthesis glycosyltransferase